jgi:hypothetical protein
MYDLVIRNTKLVEMDKSFKINICSFYVAFVMLVDIEAHPVDKKFQWEASA